MGASQEKGGEKIERGWGVEGGGGDPQSNYE